MLLAMPTFICGRKNRSALRLIVIDEKEQGKGYGKEFMSFIEKWLRL